MSIVYRIYSNGGSGGPIDYSSPIATVPNLSYSTGPLAAHGNYRFGVHAFDTSTGLEELNTQASVSISLDAIGNDIGQSPNAPYALVARPTVSGGCLVTWAYQTRGQAAPPSAFLVYLSTGAVPNLTTPTASIAYQLGTSSYRCQLTGLIDGGSYIIAIVAQSAGGISSSNLVTTNVVGDSTPPAAVDALTASAIP